MSPFQALYGQPIPDVIRYRPGDSPMPSVDETISELQRLRSIVKANLRKAQQRMVSLANVHRQDKQFQVGDMVFLKLQHYRQTSVQHRRSHKLSKRFFGPFKILERIGNVAYRLQLPQNAKIHSFPCFITS